MRAGPPAPYQAPEDFQQLYQATHLAVFRFIYSLTGGPEQDVEDLTSETFHKAWHARRRFSGDEHAALGWLLRIARNLVIDRHRTVKRRGIPDDIDALPLASAHPSPEARAIAGEDLHALLQALHALDMDDREMLVLRYVLDWRVKDIAARFDLTENTTSVRLRRVLDKLRTAWPLEDPHDH